MPNKLSQFWKELKRRKVIRAITVYAAASFVILELLSIIIEPLRLPDWTLQFAIVFLCIGFIIAIILSWIYDIHPEGGIVKTEPVHKVKPREEHTGSNSWKITSYISFAVIVALIVLNILPSNNKSQIRENLDKSIAVLPFINDSPDDENTYFINGIMEEILLNLQAIKDFQVPGRTSVEQYRNLTKSVSEIAKDLDVNYIIEGSGQKYGNTIRLRVQLLEGEKGRHIWGESYEQVIQSPEDIFKIQSQIAESIAKELEAIITPQEQEMIDRSSTSSLTAYDFFVHGREEHISYRLDNNDTSALYKAEEFYYLALEYDPSYAQAYSGLAMAYWDKYYWETYFTEDFLDSVLIYSDIALSWDNRLAEAYSLKGDYYKANGNYAQALEEYETAITINPNYWQAYAGAAELHFNDYVLSLKKLHIAVKLNHDSELSVLLASLGIKYVQAGHYGRATYYFDEALKLDRDSAMYLFYLGWLEILNDNYSTAVEIMKHAYRIDSSNIRVLEDLGFAYMVNDQYNLALEYSQKWLNRIEISGIYKINNAHRYAYIYWKTGFKKQAEYYFNLQKEYCEESIRLNRDYAISGSAYYDLAGVNAFLGDKEKAFENLRQYLNHPGEISAAMVWFLNWDPLFDNIRNEPEFKEIARVAVARGEATYKRVGKWLEENDML